MKTLQIIVFFFFTIYLNGQSFNGSYASYSTSYIDNENSENDFIENTIFNLDISIDKGFNDGIIVIQDPRIPKKLLIYKVINRSDFTEIDDRWIAIFNCKADHLERQKEVILTFYISEQKKLNLMVTDDDFSQMFFDLTLQ